MSRARTFLAAASASNLAANLLFPVLAVRALGGGNAADALFLVFILPTVVAVLLANSVLNWATPRLVRRDDSVSRRVLAWSLLWVLLGGVGALCLALWLAARLALPHLAPGGGYALAVGVLPYACGAMLATIANAVAQSLYTAERAVLPAELRLLAANVLAVLCWLIAAPHVLESCAWLFMLRSLLPAVALLPRLGRPRAPARDDRDLREILRESRLLLIAATYYKSEPFVDRLLFASAPGGMVAAYHLAHQVIATVATMMNRVVTAPLVAPLAARVHAGDGGGARRLLRGGLVRMAVVGIAVWLLFLLAGDRLVHLLLAGSAGADTAHMTMIAQMLVLLGGYLVGGMLGQVLAQTFYTTGDTRTMLWLGIATYTLGLAIRAVALWNFGVAGLAAAVSLSWLLNAAINVAFLPPAFRRQDTALRT